MMQINSNHAEQIPMAATPLTKASSLLSCKIIPFDIMVMNADMSTTLEFLALRSDIFPSGPEIGKGQGRVARLQQSYHLRGTS